MRPVPKPGTGFYRIIVDKIIEIQSRILIESSPDSAPGESFVKSVFGREIDKTDKSIEGMPFNVLFNSLNKFYLPGSTKMKLFGNIGRSLSHFPYISGCLFF